MNKRSHFFNDSDSIQLFIINSQFIFSQFSREGRKEVDDISRMPKIQESKVPVS